MPQREELVLEITAQLDQARNDVTALEEQLAALSEPIEVEIVAAVEGADEVTELAETTGELDGTEATVTVDADDEATDVLEDTADAVDDLDGASAEVDVEADDEATDAIEGAADALADLDGESATASIEVEGADEANDAVSGMLDNLGTLGAGAVTGLAAGALASVFEGAAENVLAIQGLADATGDTLENASGLAEQFDFVGISAAQVQTMIGRVNDALASSPEIAARLGVTIGGNQSPLETFVQTVDALNSGQLAASERLSLATDLFGRRSVNAVLAIDTQVGNLSESIEDIPEWQVVTDEDVDSAIEFKETMDELSDLAAETAQVFLTTLAPAIRDSFEQLEGLGGLINDVAEFGLGKDTSDRTVFRFLEDLPNFVEINDQFLEMGGTVEALRENYFHLNEVTALLDLGIPPEVVASAKLTDQALEHLAETMSDGALTAHDLKEALAAGAVSQEEWLAITADGVITMQEVKAAINDTDVAMQGAAESGMTMADVFEIGRADAMAAAAEQERMTFTTGELSDALEAMADPLETLPFLWDILIKKYREGTLESGTAEDAINQLAEATGKAPEEILRLVAAESDLRDTEIAKKLEADAKAALELAEAMADLGDTVATVDLDDLANLGGDLARALDAGDVTVDFQSVKENLRDAFGDLEEFIATEGVDIDWAAVLDTSRDTGLPSEILGLMTQVRDQFQTGIASAFEIGGTSAAQHFVDTFLPQLTALGMSPAQAYEFLGLPADGSVAVLLKPFVDAEAKADALAIIDSLIGVDPNNPVLAYIRLGVQSDEIPPQIAEIAARILAADALGIPAKLESFTDEDVAAAFAVLEGYGITVPVEVDDEGTIQGFARAADDATEDRTTQVIVPKSDSLGQMQVLIDHVARPRTVTFTVTADNAGAINSILNAVAADRNSDVNVRLPNIADANDALNRLARDRFANVFVRTRSGGGGGAGGAVPQSAGLRSVASDDGGGGGGVALLTAPAPVNNYFHTEIKAAVIGDSHAVRRAVGKANHQNARLGSRP